MADRGRFRALMVAWSYRGLRRGVVTSRYPRKIEDWARRLPSAPAFAADRLTRPLAERLAQACPAAALRVEADELVADWGRCTGCGRCIELGQGVVTASGEFLIATRNRSALVKRVALADASEVSDDRH